METKTITFGKKSGSTRPYGVLTVTETATDNVNNTSTVSINLTLKRPNTSFTSTATKHASCTVAGVTYSWAGRIGGGTGDITLVSETQTIIHNSDGAKTISMSASIEIKLDWSGEYIDTITGSGTMALTTLQLYPTSVQSVSSKTETTIVMKWSSNSTVDYIWYSKNGGSSWTGVDVADGTSGSYTISGLTANTAYSIKTRTRRKDSQLTTDSAALSVTTYAYPYANSTPNFVIGNTLTIGIYNPLGRTVTVNILGADNSQCSNDSTNKTSITGYSGAAVVNALYASIPNAKSGTYKVKVTYSGNVSTVTGGTYSVNESACMPSFTSITYYDTDNSVIAVTGNRNKIVQNKSVVEYVALGLSAKNSASIASCKVTVNNSTYNLTIAGTGASGGNAVIDSSSNVRATLTITDSRGITKSAEFTVYMLAWSAPSAIISMARHNNYYSETDITVDASYSYVDGTNSATIQYRKKKIDDSAWGSYATLSDNVEATFTADNEYEWNVQVVVTDSYGGSTTYNMILPIGMPIMFFDRVKRSAGVGCFPTEENTLEVAIGNDRTIVKVDGIKITDGTYTNTIIASGAAVTSDSDTESLSTGTWKTVATIQLGVGSYLITAIGRFTANSTGRRTIILATTNGGNSSFIRSAAASASAVSGGQTMVQFVFPYESSQSKTLYLNAYQNSGGSLDVDWEYRIARLA